MLSSMRQLFLATDGNPNRLSYLQYKQDSIWIFFASWYTYAAQIFERSEELEEHFNAGHGLLILHITVLSTGVIPPCISRRGGT